MQYYYRVSECKAVDGDSKDCICWHNEGYGPYPNENKDDPQSIVTWRGIKMSNEIEKAMNVLKQAMIDDTPEDKGSYAHAWHCNIAMACYDAMYDAKTQALSESDHNWRHKAANDAASRFMRLCFNVNTEG